MVERIQENPEFNSKQIEQLEAAGQERSAELERRLETAEQKPENLDEVRHEALELAQEKAAEKVTTSEETKEVSRPSRPDKKQLDDSFNRSMSNIRKEMKPASRTFSKVIHNKAVEKTSDAVAKTIARPNLIIAGGLGTLVLCSVVYLIAKQYGYTLSGFEAIGTFILGWSIGAIIEFARVGFLNKKD